MSIIRLLASVWLLGWILPLTLQAQEKDPLVEKVKSSIDSGVRYLKDKLEDRGGGQWNWENDSSVLGLAQPGGQSVLATLALLTAGVKADDPKLQKALPYIRGLEPRHTYVVGIQTMVLADMNQTRDLERIQINVDWLIKTRIKNL